MNSRTEAFEVGTQTRLDLELLHEKPATAGTASWCLIVAVDGP